MIRVGETGCLTHRLLTRKLVGVIDMRDKAGKRCLTHRSSKAQKIADRIGEQVVNRNVLASNVIHALRRPERPQVIRYERSRARRKGCRPAPSGAAPSEAERSLWPAERSAARNVRGWTRSSRSAWQCRGIAIMVSGIDREMELAVIRHAADHAPDSSWYRPWPGLAYGHSAV